MSLATSVFSCQVVLGNIPPTVLVALLFCEHVMLPYIKSDYWSSLTQNVVLLLVVALHDLREILPPPTQ